MSAIGDILKDARKVVVKIGSNVLSDENGFVDRDNVKDIVDQVMELVEDGKQVVIVSSGAGACGMATIHKWARRKDINYRQALCAIGQVELMMEYKEGFGKYGVHVGQILLTNEDFSDADRTLRIRNTIYTLVDEGVIPIINENDSVAVDEIKIGDNDALSALVVTLWDADALVFLSNIEGIYDKDPGANEDAKMIEEIYDIDKLLDTIEIKGTSSFGTGGIATKIEAARRVNEYSIPAILLHGKKKNILIDALNGEAKGTIFYGKEVAFK
ncbi:MAG: glutamate 5-kinase [Firmicutes bacterium]|nr:glutamate 5-kinase [Bacillota bacterium]